MVYTVTGNVLLSVLSTHAVTHILVLCILNVGGTSSGFVQELLNCQVVFVLLQICIGAPQLNLLEQLSVDYNREAHLQFSWQIQISVFFFFCLTC